MLSNYFGFWKQVFSERVGCMWRFVSISGTVQHLLQNIICDTMTNFDDFREIILFDFRTSHFHFCTTGTGTSELHPIRWKLPKLAFQST